MHLEDALKHSIFIAKQAGTYLKDSFNIPHTIHSKSHINDLVTECDKQSEEMIKSYLKQKFPDFGFLCEESGTHQSSSPFTWIIDPLDGTVNFAKKIPFFAVNIALKKNDEILCAVTYSPMTGELFSALKGQGAFLNEDKIAISSLNELSKAFGATGFPYRVHEQVAKSLTPIEKCLSMGMPLRRLGSAALDLAYLACGRFDVFFEAYLEPWDYAPGYLFMQETGAIITDFQNNRLTFTKGSSVVAANQSLHSAMLNEVLCGIN